MCFLRHLNEDECFKILDKAMAHKDKIFADELPKFVLLGIATLRLLPANYSIFQSSKRYLGGW